MKNVHEIEIKLEKEWVNALEQAFKNKNKEVKLDGFRKGKAPKDVYLKTFGIESLYGDAVDICLNDAYQKVLSENDLVPVAEPSVDVIGISDTNVIFKFKIITKPEVTLGEYKNLKVKKPKASVKADEVAQEIEHMRTHLADMIIKEDGVIETGDTAVIDFVGIVDGKEVDGAKGENYPLEIGSNSFIPGFEEGLIGLKANDKTELKLKFPENYVEDLKGKDVTFKVTINEVKTRVLPELNEEFYADLGYEDVTTKEELEKKVKEELLHRKEHELEDKFLNDVLEKAIANMQVELNEEIIDNEVHHMIDHYAQQLQMQGMNIEDYYKMTGTTEADLHKQMEPEAEKRVKYRYLLEAIIDIEKINSTDEEAEEYALNLAKDYGMEKDEFVTAIGGLDMVKYDMNMTKAVDLIKDNN